MSDALQSWSDRFRAQLEAWSPSGLGPYSDQSPTLEELVEQLPLEPGVDPSMDELHRTAMKAIVAQHIAFISCDIEWGLNCCESPIERAMLYALFLVGYAYSDSVTIRVGDVLVGGMAGASAGFEIEPQAWIDSYRVDFLLRYWRLKDSNAPRGGRIRAAMVIECDGHDFHERTREQAARGRMRDRHFQSVGFGIYHYTGAEIWRDVFAAATEAIETVGRRVEALVARDNDGAIEGGGSDR